MALKGFYSVWPTLLSGVWITSPSTTAPLNSQFFKHCISSSVVEAIANLCDVRVSFARLKALSQSADIAGMAKISIAIWLSVGNVVRLSSHHRIGSAIVLCFVWSMWRYRSTSESWSWGCSCCKYSYVLKSLLLIVFKGTIAVSCWLIVLEVGGEALWNSWSWYQRCQYCRRPVCAATSHGNCSGVFHRASSHLIPNRGSRITAAVYKGVSSSLV